MNCRKKEFVRLSTFLSGGINRLVISRKDRPLRFGAELVLVICAMTYVEVFIN